TVVELNCDAEISPRPPGHPPDTETPPGGRRATERKGDLRMGILNGQIAIVTGGGSGIGRGTAGMLRAQGRRCVGRGSRPGRRDETVAKIARAGGKAVARTADMESPTDPGELAKWALTTFGRVDILINNAGHSSTIRAIRWVRKSDWDSVIAANVTGVDLLSQAVAPTLIKPRGGALGHRS